MVERVKCAAVRTPEGHIIIGPYHGKCLQTANEAGFENVDSRMGQGFITTKLRFVLRKEALIIAEREGQIVKKHKPDDVLLSEDFEELK